MMTNQSIKRFAEDLAAKKPVPGGGGAASVVGALAAALASMVVNYTIGKKRYSKYNDRLELIIKKAGTLKEELLELIQKDAEAFEPLSAAYSLPADTEDEKRKKTEIMEKALYEAAIVPMEIARRTCMVIDLHDELLEVGSKMLFSDIGVGAALAGSALKSAALNIYINTKLMTDKDKILELNKEIEELCGKYIPLSDEIYEKVLKRLSERK